MKNLPPRALRASISEDIVKRMEGVNDPEDWSPCSGCLFYKHLDDTNFNVMYCIPCAAFSSRSSCFSILRTVSEAPKPFDLRSLFRPTTLASATIFLSRRNSPCTVRIICACSGRPIEDEVYVVLV